MKSITKYTLLALLCFLTIAVYSISKLFLTVFLAVFLSV
ncbi:hypothetical protein STRDD10_00018 [Streptococcus sp. DD10]|nr:hypothetical protein STRDD10_00018 [Streptococcus sp. DD10]